MNKFIKNNSKTLILILFCFIIALISIFICSKNSPLYPFNNWVDENSFFTVAKGWAHGLIPYKDLFEQKGPLLFFLFLIGYIISQNSFFGIFILEVISFTVCLYWVSKIIRLFLRRQYVFYILPLFSSIICSSISFFHGGSAEEFCLSFLAISFYYFLNYFTKNELTYKQLFINGLIAGCISMIKFNLLGFWFAFMMCIFISKILKKEIKKSIISCFIFLSGMMVPILLFSIYFIIVGGFSEFINVYILFNINGYSIKMSLFRRVYEIYKLFINQLSLDFVILNLIDVGILYFIFSKRILKNWISKIFIILIILFSILGVYWGTVPYPYYFLFILFFIIFGLIALFYQLFDNQKLSRKKNIIILFIIFLISILQLFKSNNIEYMKNSKDSLIQYKFAKIINEKKNATLLNWQALDGGFYFAADILPNTYYFHKVNASLPKLEEELLEKIKSKKFDFIVVRCYKTFDPRNEILYDNYTLVSEGKEVMENIEFTYYLYRKN